MNLKEMTEMRSKCHNLWWRLWTFGSNKNRKTVPWD